VTAHVLALAFPTRGVPGGWRGWWDDPNDHAEVRAQAEAVEQRLEAKMARIGRRWQREILQEQQQRRRGGLGR
jgi:hypothetical protein